MKIKTLYLQLSQSPAKLKLALTAALVAGGMLCLTPLTGYLYRDFPTGNIIGVFVFA